MLIKARLEEDQARGGKVQLLWADLDMPPLPFELLETVISPSEIARARRFVCPQARRRWINGRGMLRHCLARWRGADPREMPLTQSQHGKPILPGGPAFNLSHSGSQLLIAISSVGRVGVDVEMCRFFEGQDELLREVCTPTEADAIVSLPNGLPVRARTLAFFRTWVRKEAFVKGIGTGVSMALRECDVSHESSAGNLLRRVRMASEANVAWQIHSVLGPPGVEAAVAWDQPELVPEVIEWPWTLA